MTVLAEIRDLSVRYRRDGAEVTALRGISLDVVAGERLAIIGESGSGKSTLALAVAGLLPGSAEVANGQQRRGHDRLRLAAAASTTPSPAR